MTVVAGIDVGNATTEVVAVRHDSHGVEVLGADRLPTRGRKGSLDSLNGAAALVRRLERALGSAIDVGVVAPLRAVETSTLSIPELAPATGRLRIVASGVDTPGGRGACIGPPVALESLVALSRSRGSDAGSGDRSFVVLLPEHLHYRAAAEHLKRLRDEGWPIGAVLVPGDEGVLVSNRLGPDIPVVDLVDTGAVSSCALLGVEVRDPGQALRLLSDPVALAAGFGLCDDDDLYDTGALCRLLLDSSNAVVSLQADRAAPEADDVGWVELRAVREPFREVAPRLSDCAPGSVTAFAAPFSTTPVQVDDLWAVDLGVVADTAGQRKGSLSSRAFVVAALLRMTTGGSPAARMSELLELPVVGAPSETAAARAGALTTPGALRSALVIDIGAGTIDVIAPDTEIVAAGAGEMLTMAVAETLGVPLAAADWVKRGASLRVEAGQRYEAEDGTRGFLARPAAPGATGMLAVTGPAGLLAFDRRHSPAEWRSLRLRLKEAVLATNLKRALLLLGTCPRQVLIVGGPTGDDELLGVLTRALPEEVVIGRGAVGATLERAAGRSAFPLGHRYAAALGLAMAQEGADASAR